nr:DUF1302 family protein [Rhodoferax sp.]
MRLKRTSKVRVNQSRQGLRSVAVATSLMAAASCSLAGQFETGNPDLEVRWDNTVKYGAGVRVGNVSDTLTKNVAAPASGLSGSNALNGDDGDRNFAAGNLISSRIDLLSEFDLVYRKDFGLRVSAAAWYDSVYNRGNANDSPATNNSLTAPSNDFTDATRKLHGNNAELLDAFFFGATDVGTARLSGRLGRHTVLWGESVFFGANAISGTQSPVDVVKASSVPGSTTKELLMPVGQVSGQLQLSPALTLMGYYQYEWKATRLPGAGSYFSVADFLGAGGERIKIVPGVLGNGLGRATDMNASDDGQYGLAIRSHLGEFDVGAYATRFHAKTPVLYSRSAVPPNFASPAGFGQYQAVFPEGIQAYGVSATTTSGTVNYAGEISVRRGTPLTSDPQAVTGLLANNNDNPFYAIGDTAHANFSLIWTMPRSFLSDEPSLSMEVAYNQLTSCNRNCTPAAPGGFRANGALDPGADNSAAAVRLAIAAPRRNVVDGLDLTPSISVGYSVGKSPVVTLGPDRGGDITFSLGGNYLTVWDFSLAFTHYYGQTNTAVYSSIDPKVNGNYTFAQSLQDRDFISLSLRRTF